MSQKESDVEIIYCKQCKHSDLFSNGWCHCNNWGDWVLAGYNGFCSEAVKAECEKKILPWRLGE